MALVKHLSKPHEKIARVCERERERKKKRERQREREAIRAR